MKAKEIVKVICAVSVVGLSVLISGCSADETTKIEVSTPEATTPQETTTPEETTPGPTTPEPTTPEPTTAEPTVPEETTAKPFKGAWSLLTNEPVNPRESGYEELDSLIQDLFDELQIDKKANGYYKAWACYEYMIDNITYSRGMEANAGAFSDSDPSSTPVEVLWATDLLNSGKGCCYNYSAAYMYILRALGYDAYLVSGNVPKYGGGVTPHCWVYANIDGDKYIFDPDIDMNFYTRAVQNGQANPKKDQYFCVRMDTVSYFYKPEKYHTN